MMGIHSKKSREFLAGYGLIMPTLILLGIIVFYPLIHTFYLSFFDTSLVLPKPEFIGLQGYGKIIKSKILWIVIKNSFIWTVIVVIFQFIIGLASAVLLNQKFKGRALARAIVILPWVTPGVIVAMVWRLMYHPQLGLLNRFLFDLGLIKDYVAWLGYPNTALYAVIISAIWKGFPFSTIMYLAALQTVPQELYEAANLDGSNRWQSFFRITIPQIMSVIRVTLLLTSILTFNYFELIYVMTKGGPGKSSHIFPTYIYQIAFVQFRFGPASRYAVISFLLLLIFALIYIGELNKRKVFE